MYLVFHNNDSNELKRLDTYQYWNNENEEKKKDWDIRDGNFNKIEKYLLNSGLSEDLLKALRLSGLRSKTMLRGIELGGGVCWSALFLFRQLDIKEMRFLDFSEHRIVKIAPLILQHYNIPSDKVKLMLGSFYETNCLNESMDSPEDWKKLCMHSGWKVLWSEIYFQYPTNIPVVSHVCRKVWKKHDFEGFMGMVMKRDMSVSNRYKDWEE